MCEQCKQEMIELLERRIRKILVVYGEGEDDEEIAVGESHCFYLMEIQLMLKGGSTSGLYDDSDPTPAVADEGTVLAEKERG